LDVFWDYGGALENFVHHRSATHSIVIQTIATPILAEVLRKLFKDQKSSRIIFYFAVWLILVTHTLLDATTIYGTQLLWPITDYPFGVGSMFIIDPLYTLPLLIITLWALIFPKWSSAFNTSLNSALIVSTAYLGWSMIAQSWMQEKAERQFASHGIEAERILVIPLPFSTFAWKAIAIQPQTYTNLYLPLLPTEDKPIFYQHERWPANLACEIVNNYPAHTILNAFTKGFYSLSYMDDGNLLQSDLRMGMTPDYVFRFKLVPLQGDMKDTASIAERVASARSQEGDFPWLINMISGEVSPRPAEKEHLTHHKGLLRAQKPQHCDGTG
jgi:inner membrane protein